MNQDRVIGICKQFGGTVKESWGRLTGNPFLEIAGTRARRDGRMLKRYGASQEAAARQLKEFFARNRNWHAPNR
jgi:uncharacterized protein YjbJ (UPF0337 family)